MQPDRFTIRAQEALAESVRLAQAAGNPQVTPAHVLSALLADRDGIAISLLRKLGADPAKIAGPLNAALAALPVLGNAAAEAPPIASELAAVLNGADGEARKLGDDYVSTEHLLLALSAHPGKAGDALRSAGATHERLQSALEEVRGIASRHRPEPRGPLPGARALRPRPDRRGRRGQARPGDRARRGDPPRRPDPRPADQEQPRADRRAGRRQDRGRRGSRPADRLRRCARDAARPPRGRARPRLAAGRRQVPRRVRGPPQGGAQGDRRRRGQQ